MTSNRTIKAIDGPETMVVTRTRNKEIVLTSVFNVMGAIIADDAVCLEEDFQDLSLKDGETLEPLGGPFAQVNRQGDKLKYHLRRPEGFQITINRDDLARALSELKHKPWWNPF